MEAGAVTSAQRAVALGGTHGIVNKRQRVGLFRVLSKQRPPHPPVALSRR